MCIRDSASSAPVCRSDSNHMRCRGAKSFVDDLVLSRGVVRSRAVHCCDLLRLSPLTRRFVRFRRTDLLGSARVPRSFAAGGRCWPGEGTCNLSLEPVAMLAVRLFG